MNLSEHEVNLLTQVAIFAGVVFAGVRSYLNGRGQSQIRILVDGANDALRADVLATRTELRDLNSQFAEYLVREAHLTQTQAASALAKKPETS